MCRIVVGEGPGGLSEAGHGGVRWLCVGYTCSRFLCLCPQASFLGGCVQCYAHHLLRISGAGCKDPVTLSAHSPFRAGPHITGRMGTSWEERQKSGPWGLSFVPVAFVLQHTSFRKPGKGSLCLITVTFILTVPCEQRARLQQHAAAQGEDLGWGGDSRHGHRPRCLHGHG